MLIFLKGKRQKMEVWHLVLLAVTGCVAGFINVMAGGGSLLTMPVMVMMGMPMIAMQRINMIMAMEMTMIVMKGTNMSMAIPMAILMVKSLLTTMMMTKMPSGTRSIICGSNCRTLARIT